MSIITSFFVECSYKENEIKKNRIKGLKMSLIIAIISIFAIFLFGNFILSLFGVGEEYLNSLSLLYVFIISVYFFAINRIYSTELVIKKKIKSVLIFNFLITGSIIMIGTLLMFYFGLLGVGYGWLIGQIIGITWILVNSKLFDSCS